MTPSAPASDRAADKPLDTRNWAEIDLQALRHNIRRLNEGYSGPRRRVMAVVKADAYGHGLQNVAPVCAAQRITDFGVASLGEALAVRELTPPSTTVYLLSPAIPDDAPHLVAAGVIPLISDLDFALAVASAARRQGVVAAVHVEVDTGIGRAGISPGALLGLLDKLNDLKGLSVTGLSTHYASADEDADDVALQDREFARALEFLGPRSEDLTLHSDNSPAALLRRTSGDSILSQNVWLMRPGLLLYGIEPASGMADAAQADFQAVLSLRARVALCRELPAGASISYGRTYRVPEGGGTYATIPIGYGDGYPRALSNLGWALVHGRKAPIRGRVCMDQLVLDVSGIPNVAAGDTATLIGRADGSRVTATELAEAGGLTPHELTTCLTPRVPRCVLNA